MLKDSAGWVALGVLVVLLLLLAGGAVLARARRRSRDASDPSPHHGRGTASRLRLRRRPPRDHFRTEGVAADQDRPRRRAAIVANPTKLRDVATARQRAVATCVSAGWAEPLWLETTVDDPGYGQARRAITDEVDLVCALGGDGTVRNVASALVGTDTPMGLLPAGTGNLLARNLGVAHDSLRASLLVALHGRNKRVDVGRLTVNPSGEHERPEEHVFLIMAGMGFDAVVVSEAPPELKAKMGWLAYGVAGMKNLQGPRFTVRATFGEEDEIRRKVSTVVIGNCGKLTAGVVLLPDAEIDDGFLDSVILSPKGLAGWAAVAARVLTRRRGGHERVEHHRSVDARLQADRAVEVQLDGDSIGVAREISARVDPLALTVRVPT